MRYVVNVKRTEWYTYYIEADTEKEALAKARGIPRDPERADVEEVDEIETYTFPDGWLDA